MAEVLVDFETDVLHDGVRYRPHAVGRPGPDGMWQGWLEFVPPDGGEAIVTGVESTQPEREHLVYWATGLTPVYLEGAFQRARRPAATLRQSAVAPASPSPTKRSVKAVGPPGPQAVLDPFDLGSRNLDMLRQQLGALDRPRLLNIIAAYGLGGAADALNGLTDHQLATFIVTAVDARLVRRRA